MVTLHLQITAVTWSVVGVASEIVMSQVKKQVVGNVVLSLSQLAAQTPEGKSFVGGGGVMVSTACDSLFFTAVHEGGGGGWRGFLVKKKYQWMT